ncbi:hypothetical protein AMELA_G00105590 [Ameiurus melas]|uniref:Uncharacterized protein n=1 Tax=Ameiurus melas TaxID=219545 RepID=A0A7J6AW32_AMEME|nr:hypothetical protein AMELA_G00105590 [Ameiurus melas]
MWRAKSSATKMVQDILGADSPVLTGGLESEAEPVEQRETALLPHLFITVGKSSFNTTSVPDLQHRQQLHL